MKRLITREQLSGKMGWSIDDGMGGRTFYADGVSEKALVNALRVGVERDVEFIAHDKYINDGTPVIVVLFDDAIEQYSLDKFKEVFGDCDETFSEVWNGNGFIKEDRMDYREVYKGRILAEWEINRYDDSDFMIAVWDTEKKDVERFCYASTSFPSVANCKEDFDWEKYGEDYREWLAEWSASLHIASHHTLTGKPCDKGKQVRVSRGRKVPIGTEGTILSISPNEFDDHNKRITLKVGGSYPQTYLYNLDVIPLTEEERSQIREAYREYASTVTFAHRGHFDLRWGAENCGLKLDMKRYLKEKENRDEVD